MMATMGSKFMPEEKVVALHLSYREPQPEFHLYSGFAAALRDARQTTGRDIATGDVIDASKCGSWIGAVAYLILVDQIGECFRPKNVAPVPGNSFMKALKYFTDLDQAECDALYALRCAFVHDFSFYNRNEKKPSLQHAFRLVASDGGRVVTLPTRPWSGDYSKKQETTVNLRTLGSVVEAMAHKLFELSQTGELAIELKGGSDELLQRYSIFALPRRKREQD